MRIREWILALLVLVSASAFAEPTCTGVWCNICQSYIRGADACANHYKIHLKSQGNDADVVTSLPTDLNRAALGLGVAFHDRLVRESEERARRITAARAEWDAQRERYAAAEAREREARYARIAGEMKLDGPGLLPRGFDGDGGALTLKGVGDSPDAAPALKLDDHSNCFFGDCGRKPVAPADDTWWDTKVVDLRNLRRGAWLASRATLVASPDDARSTADDAIGVALGDPSLQSLRIPEDASLPPVDGAGLAAFQAQNAAYRAARDSRFQAAEAFALATRRRELADRIVAEMDAAGPHGANDAAYAKAVAQRTEEREAEKTAEALLGRAKTQEEAEKDLARHAIRYEARSPRLVEPADVPEILRSAEDANGKPYVDCRGATTRIAEWNRALGVQKADYERTVAQRNGARTSSQQSASGGRAALVSAAASEAAALAADIASSARTLRAAKSTLESTGATRGQARDAVMLAARLEATIKAMEDARDKVQSALKAEKDGMALVESARASLLWAEESLRILATEERLTAAGEKLASLLGPQGALAFRAAKLSLDLGAAGLGESAALAETSMAERNVESMAWSYNRNREMRDRLVEGCSAK